MQLGGLAYVLPLFLATLLTGAISLYAFFRVARPGALTLALLMAATSEWSALYAFELLLPDLPGKILAAKLQYLGITAIPSLWLSFALRYTGRDGWLTLSRRLFLAAPGVITFILALTNEWHRLIWRDVGLDPQGAPALFISGHGAWFWVWTLIAYLFILAGIVLYAWTFAHAARPYRRQTAVMLLGALVPLAGNALFLAGLSPLPWLDLTPFFFTLSGVLLALAFFRFGLLDLLPIAAPVVLEHLQDAVIVVDISNRVLNLNPAARRLFGVDERVIGRNVLEVLWPLEIMQTLESPAQEREERIEFEIELPAKEGRTDKGMERRAFQLTVSPLRDQNEQLMGRLLALREITREHALLESERRRARQMALLNEITQAALGIDDFREMLQGLADRLGELFEADGAFITLWGEAQKRTIPMAAYGELRVRYPTMHPEPGETTLTESVLRAGHPLAVEDVFHTPYLSPRIAALFPSRSLLALPLIAGERKLGAALVGFNQTHHFDAEEVALGEQVAAQLALAVAQAQLLETQRRRLEQKRALVQMANDLLTASDSATFWAILMQTAQRVLSADRAAVYLYDRATDRLSCPYAAGLSAEYVAAVNRLFRQIPGGRLLSRPEPVSIADAQTDPATAVLHEHIIREGYHSYAVFPLIAPEGIFGAFTVYRDAIWPFSEDDIAIGQMLAHLVGSAFENLRLLEAEREQRQLAETLRQASLALGELLDLPTLLDRLLVEIGRVVPYDAANVMLVEPKERRIHVAAMRGYEQFGPQVVQEVASLNFVIAATANLRRMAETRRPLIVPDTAADPNWLRVAVSAYTRSWAGAPIVARDQVVAFFSLDKIEPGFYRPEHADRLAAFAGQAAIAIENARLFAETQRRAEEQRLLFEATREFTAALDEQTVLAAMARHLANALSAASCTVSLWDRARDQVVTLFDWDRSPDKVEPAGTIYPLGQYPLTRQVLESCQPLVVRADDPAADPAERAILERYGYSAVLMLPLLSSAHVLGLIELSRTSDMPPFNGDEIRLAQNLAGPAGVALENARLHAEVQALAVTDELTGLANRRAFDRALQREFARAVRFGDPLALIMADLDSFKEYNDTYGHLAGDERLKVVARLLEKNTRDIDIVARYGGEEFALILPHTDKGGALVIAERIRAAAEAQAPLFASLLVFRDSDGHEKSSAPIPGYTLSLGVAAYPDDAETAEELLRAADDAELAAKRAGKNRVGVGTPRRDVPTAGWPTTGTDVSARRL